MPRPKQPGAKRWIPKIKRKGVKQVKPKLPRRKTENDKEAQSVLEGKIDEPNV